MVLIQVLKCPRAITGRTLFDPVKRPLPGGEQAMTFLTPATLAVPTDVIAEAAWA